VEDSFVQPLRSVQAVQAVNFRIVRSATLFAVALEAKKRFGLSVLNYMVTSNHIQLSVRDTGSNVIPQSMQLIAETTET
jgi:hypothetical protein